MMKIPILELKRQYDGIRGKIESAINEVFETTSFIMGPAVDRFERGLAKYLGAKHAVSCASGSDALLLCNMALGVKDRDEVITTPYTFFATVSAITRLGAYPALIDIDPKTYNISASGIENYLKKYARHDKKTGRTVNRKTKRNIKAIVPVHLYGQAVDMDEIMEVASRYGIPVIEDAAQSIGALYKGKATGAIGLAGCFSFYPTKNLGACGDGGMIVTDDDNFADLVRTLRVHGAKVKYYHKFVGINSRLDSLQAAILGVKLEFLDEYIQKRIAVADIYDEVIKEKLPKKVTTPFRAKNRTHTFHQYIIKVSKRDELREFLKANGVGTEIYYPLPLHEQECFAYLKYKHGSFPNAEKASRETLALPVYPELMEDQQEYIVDRITEFYGKK